MKNRWLNNFKVGDDVEILILPSYKVNGTIIKIIDSGFARFYLCEFFVEQRKYTYQTLASCLTKKHDEKLLA